MSGSTGELKVTRRIAASPAEVFEVWSDPALMGEWLCEGGRCVADVRPGGLYVFDMKHEGRLWPHFGEFLRVESPRLIEFTWHSEGTKGTRTTVTVTFDAVGQDETQLTIEHRELPAGEVKSHTDGWTGFLEISGNYAIKRRAAKP